MTTITNIAYVFDAQTRGCRYSAEHEFPGCIYEAGIWFPDLESDSPEAAAARAAWQDFEKVKNPEDAVICIATIGPDRRWRAVGCNIADVRRGYQLEFARNHGHKMPPEAAREQFPELAELEYAM